uniref:SET domain-containing protein n=1 Tax=Globisporangium ultimum (strain ATCC 200006 / CBS 805.95 / DAOM BR144) TaxID=431595 RepID=K3WKR8_GLOUD
MSSSLILQRVQDAVRRTRGCVVSSAIEAQLIPRMGVGVVAKERIPKDTLIFQAGADAWYPFSAEYALAQAQKKAPGFLNQLNQLFASNPAFAASPFVPNALVLSVHLLVNFPRSQMPQVLYSNVTDATMEDLYVNSLPSFVDLPFYWEENQFQELDACQEVARGIQQSSKFYSTIYQHLFGNGNGFVNPEAFFWAISILMSRATSGKEQPFTLIPFFDWFNHADNGDECVHGFDPQHGFTVHTTRAYEPGEQLCITYGHHGNTRLLRNYGFTLPTNPHDVVDVPLPIQLQQVPTLDAMSQEKQELLHLLRFSRTPGAMITKKTLQVLSDGQLSAESHQWLQVLLASRDELQGIFQQATSANSSVASQQTSSSLQLPPSLTGKIHNIVTEICSDRLKKHKFSLERDKDFLLANDQQMASWLRSCLHIRMGEKQTLLNAIWLHAN